jgi:hypothetical protein
MGRGKYCRWCGGASEEPTMSDRYTGKPFLKLLDSYVLHAIGSLPESNEQQLAEMTPKIQATFNAAGDWRAIVRKVMEFPDDIDDAIRRTWQHNQNIAAREGVELTPVEFAHMFVDTNFL